MRVIVCGGRSFTDRDMLFAVLDALNTRRPVSLLIEGGARGADVMAGAWADARGIGHQMFAADWQAQGPSAGPIRNQRMLDEGRPDLVVAFEGRRGTAHMKRIALEAGIEVFDVVEGALRQAG
jgi:hypothetical protein